jgi:hypothetical protein
MIIYFSCFIFIQKWIHISDLYFYLDDRGVGIRVPVGEEIFLLHSVQIGSVAHPACYPLGIESSFPGSKAAGAWSWPLTPTIADFKKSWIYISTPPYALMA